MTSLGSFSPRRALVSLRRLLRDPDDLPEVFTLIDSLSGLAPLRMRRRLRRSLSGARLLRARPDIVPLLSDRERLRQLPAGSLGRAYLAFVESEGISAAGIVEANERAQVAAPERSPELAWVHARMRDTHDLWHAVTGYQGDVLGEASLLAFLLAQTGNAGVGLIVAAALMKSLRDPEVRRTIVTGFRRGWRANWLPEVEWESLLALPVDEVRARLGVDAPPRYRPIRSAELRADQAARSLARRS
jgi:ubiquinone biosynthesis protein COQ4